MSLGQPWQDPATGQWYNASGQRIPPPTNPVIGPPTQNPLNNPPNTNSTTIEPGPGPLAGAPPPTPVGAPPPSTAPPPNTNGGPTGTGGLALAPPGPAPAPPSAAQFSGAVPPTPVFTPPPYTPPPAFQLPSIADAMNQPGYQFQVQQGENALQNWAGAKGTLNDSDTAQQLEQFGQSSAQTDYANVVGQDLQAYNTNYQTQYTDPYAIAYQGATAAFAPKMTAYTTQASANQFGLQTNWQDEYNAWLAQNQLLQGEQGIGIQGANAGL